MAHKVETMAYAHKAGSNHEAYQTPWHGLGVPVIGELSPHQMMKKAGLDWSVDRYPSFIEIEGKKILAGKDVLVRSSDNKILTHISEGWEPVQNETAFEFFAEYVAAGHMEMNTAGSLKGGKMVWALAKINDSFDAVKGDQVDSYLLFSNPHEYGTCIDIRFTAIRVVCNNTLTLALSTTADQQVRRNHTKKFDAEEVKAALGISHQNMEQYKQAAQYMSKRKFSVEALMEYYATVFPLTGKASKEDGPKPLSRAAQTCLDHLDTQPGAKYAKGSWWQAYNSVTYCIDHELGHSQETRLASSWYGPNRQKKIVALEKAVEYAGA